MFLINTLLEKARSNIYISIGSLDFLEINKIIKMYANNDRIKFNYTQLSYNSENINFLNLLKFAKNMKINSLMVIIT